MIVNHIVHIDIERKKIRYAPITITQNDSTDNIEFIFDTDNLNSEIEIRALTPNGEKYKYTLEAERYDVVIGEKESGVTKTANDTLLDDGIMPDFEMLTFCKASLKIPNEISSVVGYCIFEIKLIDTDGILTIGRFGVNVSEDLFESNVVVPFTEPVVGCFVVDSMACY